MECIAHRGCADEYPENTVRAVERSSRHLSTVELDVRRCRSGELIVFHDETVDRVTEGSGSVARMDWDRLRELEILRSGERIPRFSEALAAIPADVDAQIELKQAGVAADAVAAVEASDVDARFTSFLPEALAEVRERDPAASLGYLFGREVGVDAGLDTGRALGCEFLHPSAELCLETDVVERARRTELTVLAWGVDDAATFDALRERDVSGATADSWTLAGVEPELEPVAAD